MLPYQETNKDGLTIYERSLQGIQNLTTVEFQQFWELLPIEKKQMILSMPIKELLVYIRENPYWYVFRYFIQHWDLITHLIGEIDIERTNELIYIARSKITTEMVTKIIDYAREFCKLMIPKKSSTANLFNELLVIPSAGSGEEKTAFVVSSRFQIFVGWLLCNNIIREYQYHRDVEEANRNAAMVLNENLNEMEKTKTKKNKRNKKKKEGTVVKETPPPTPKEEFTIQSDFSLQSILAVIGEEIAKIKPAVMVQKELPQKDSSNSNTNTNTKQEKKEREIRKEALRINKFLQGEKRDTSVVFNDKKEDTQTEQFVPKSFYSLACSSSVLFSPIEDSPYSSEDITYPSCHYASILPSLQTFKFTAESGVIDSSDTELSGSNEENGSESTTSLQMARSDIALTPTQILQNTVQKHMDEENVRCMDLIGFFN